MGDEWYNQYIEDNPPGKCGRCLKETDTHAIYFDLVPNCIILKPGVQLKEAGHAPIFYTHLCQNCLKEFYKWVSVYRTIKPDVNEEAEIDKYKFTLDELNEIRKKVIEEYRGMI